MSRFSVSRFSAAFWKAGAVAALLLGCHHAHAVPTTSWDPSTPLKAVPAAKADLARIFAAKYGSTSDEINPTPLPGIYQIVAGTRIVYMDGTGQYAIEGGIMDLHSALEISEVKRRGVVLKSLNPTDAIKIVHGNGSRVLYTFEDPSCGYCRKLATETADIPNVTIYTFPLYILGQGSHDKAIHIWCAKDRAAAWSSYLNNPAYSETNDISHCNAGAIDRNMELAKKLGISGTPTLFFKDGSRQNGYAPRATLDQRIQ